MKAIPVILFVALCSIALAGPIEITPDEAAKHVGEICAVSGPVAGSHAAKGHGFLDFGDSYPNQVFTAFFPDVNLMAGTKACSNPIVTVTGKIQLYRNKPEIVITRSDQVK